MSSQGQLTLRPGAVVTGVAVFSSSRPADRHRMGDDVSQWIADHPEHQLIDVVVSQSSDSRFHCLSVVVFFGVDAAIDVHPPAVL